MRILLSYSSQHFDPRKPREHYEHYRGGSANVISSTLHELLGRHGEVTFVDAADPVDVAGRAFDLFVGISRNFGRILAQCDIGCSIFVGVNMHPAEHNRRLLDFVVRERLPSRALHQLDILPTGRISHDIEAADAILLFGNVATFDSYIRQGVPRSKLRLLNYATRPPVRVPVRQSPGTETQLLYLASEIGLRKGFDVLAGAVTRARLEKMDAHLHVVGSPSYPHYRDKLRRLAERLGPSMTTHGWLPAAGAEYGAVLDRADFLVFPSLEEGQAGTVLDAIAHGVIPLISRAAGVDFAPLGFCEPRTISQRNVDLLAEACFLAPRERAHLRERTVGYYDEFHLGFQQHLERELDDMIAGRSQLRSQTLLRTARAGRRQEGPHRPSIHRTAIDDDSGMRDALPRARQRVRRRYLNTRRRWLNAGTALSMMSAARNHARI